MIGGELMAISNIPSIDRSCLAFFSIDDTAKTTQTLRSCLKATKIRSIDGKILGRNGQPLIPVRQVQFGGAKPAKSSVEERDTLSLNETELPTTYDTNSSPKSFASVLHGSMSECAAAKVNFRKMSSPDVVENTDFVLPIASVQAVQHKFENSVVGFFVGKKVPFTIVKNYVTNTWAKFGFEKIMSDDDGLFYFKFSSGKGVEQDEVTRVPVWVKLHKVPVVAYSADGLSLIASQIGNPIMLDAFTSAICVEAWGRIGGEEERCGLNVFDATINQHNDDSESDIEEVFVEENPNSLKGASTPVTESHVDISLLSQVCSKVFKAWDLTSNANLCTKGNKVSERRVLWSELGLHKQVVRGCPWILLGDFNVTLNLEDSHSGSYDINSSGLHFTWNQKPKGGGGILRKLDRIMGNLEFLDAFLGAHAYFHPYRISDHSPAVLKIPDLPMNKPKPFKFFNFITHKSKFLEILDSQWNVVVPGHHMYQVTSKLKALKKPLRKLVHDLGNLHDRVKNLRCELDEVQRALDLNPTDQVLCEEEAVYVQAFNEVVLDEERFLKQKAKIEWLDVGDSNFAYFHKSLKSRNQRIRIEVILNADNVEISGPNVPNVFVQHYEKFLGTDMACDELNCDGLFHKQVSEQSCSIMIRPITDLEIKTAMFSIGDDKAPGPDGYTSAFFKKGWDIVGHDVCKAVHDFFINGQLLKEINHTFIALIPKVSTPHRINDYRPISCCNVIYKCISKILTNRIIEGIKEVVSDNQSAFVPGRRISDNILLTQELMYAYHRDIGPPRCAFKIDIQKAYDTVDWHFMDVILKRFGFPPLINKWIMACVSSTSFSIGVNGDIHGFFKGKRGLRQGDPLSPYLFTLVMEVLTLILQRRVRDSDSFRFHKHCEELQLINVCFADDLFIFARGDVDSARVIRDSLEEFTRVSGLVPSLPKSTTFFCNVANHVKLSILNTILFLKQTSVIILECLLSLLDFLIGIGDGQYFFRLFPFDACILGFGFDDPDRWLGIRSLEVFNIALMTTHIWNIVSNKESLWVRWINAYKLKGRSFWDVPLKNYASWGWRKLIRIRDLVRPFFWSKIVMAMVWSSIRHLACMDVVPAILEDVVSFLQPIAHQRTVISIIGRLLLAATAYYIWDERNKRVFKQVKRSWADIRDIIITTVRLKLFTLKFKNKERVIKLLAEWKMPKNFLRSINNVGIVIG
ncbi:aspartic peptidase [Tanacetum coccineum]